MKIVIPSNRAVSRGIFLWLVAALALGCCAPNAGAQRIKLKSTRIEMATVSGVVGESVTIEGFLRASVGSEALADRKLTFYVSSSLSGGDFATVGTATTSADGLASVSYKIPESQLKGKKNNTVRIKATFGGDTAPKDGVRYTSGTGIAYLKVSRAVETPPDPGATDPAGTTGATGTTASSGAKGSAAAPASGDSPPAAAPKSAKSAGTSGETAPPSTSSDESPKPVDELSALLKDELLKFDPSHEFVSAVMPSVVPAGSGVDAEAFGLVLNGFDAAYPRFWLEAHLQHLSTEPKKIAGMVIPGAYDLKVVMRFVLVDAFTSERQEWAKSKTKSGIGMKFPTIVGDVLKKKPDMKPKEDATPKPDTNTKVNAANNASSAGKKSASRKPAASTDNSASDKHTATDDSGDTKTKNNAVVFQQVLGSKEGTIIKDALMDGIKEAGNRLKKSEWMVRVADVSGERIYLSGGKGSGIAVGQSLSIKQFIKAIKDGERILEIEYTPQGIVQVTEVRDNTIIAKLVSGSGGHVEKGFLATKASSNPPAR